MSQIPPVPSPETVEALSSPWYARPTLYSTVGGILGNLAGGVTALVAVFSQSPHTQLVLGIVAGCLLVAGNTALAVGVTLARNAGINSAAAVHDRLAPPPQDLFPPGTVPPGGRLPS